MRILIVAALMVSILHTIQASTAAEQKSDCGIHQEPDQSRL